MESKVFRVRDKRLEQFLFCHDIFFVSSWRDEDGSMVWEYDDSPMLRSVLTEWKDIVYHRELRKRNGKFVAPIHRPKRS